MGVIWALDFWSWHAAWIVMWHIFFCNAGGSTFGSPHWIFARRQVPTVAALVLRQTRIVDLGVSGSVSEGEWGNIGRRPFGGLAAHCSDTAQPSMQCFGPTHIRAPNNTHDYSDTEAWPNIERQRAHSKISMQYKLTGLTLGCDVCCQPDCDVNPTGDTRLHW